MQACSQPWTATSCADAWQRDLTNAKIKDIRIHDLRRTGATRLYRGCRDIEMVRQALGHSDQQTTWIYIGEQPGDLGAADLAREVYEKVERSLAEVKAAGGKVDLTVEEQQIMVGLMVSVATTPAATLRKITRSRPEASLALRRLLSLDEADGEATVFASDAIVDAAPPVQTADGPIGPTIDMFPTPKGDGADRSPPLIEAPPLDASSIGTTYETILEFLLPDQLSLQEAISQKKVYWTTDRKGVHVAYVPGSAADEDMTRDLLLNPENVLQVEDLGTLDRFLAMDYFWLEACGYRVLVAGRARFSSLLDCARPDDPLGRWAMRLRGELSGCGRLEEFETVDVELDDESQRCDARPRTRGRSRSLGGTAAI